MSRKDVQGRRLKSSLSPPPERMPPDHIGVLISGLAMMFIGWMGLFLLVRSSPPRIGAELWLFFVLLHLAVTGTVLPFVRYANVRLLPTTVDPPAGGIIVRQSVWIGLYVVICAWLQILRSLNAPIAFFLALVFVVIEIFLRTREISDTRSA
jgi:hypothetical protein